MPANFLSHARESGHPVANDSESNYTPLPLLDHPRSRVMTIEDVEMPELS
jgi:hypothetical protein